MGSRRTLPMVPAAAAVISDPMVAPTYTPAVQLNAWKTSGMVVARRPPKINALIGTPFGSSHAGSIVGHCEAGAVKRDLGGPEAALPVEALGGWFVRHPSHQTPPSGVSATLVKIEFFASVFMALGF